MKILISILLILLFSPKLLGQEWRDSLREARNSYANKNYDRSFRLYRSAQKLAPREIDLSDEVAQSAYKAGKYEDAEKIYAQSSSLKGSAVQKGTVHRQIGNARMKQQKYGEAVESYKEALRNNPKDETARYNLAEAMRKQKEQKEQTQKSQDNSKKQDPKDQKDQKQDPGQKGKQQNQNQSGQEKKDQQGQPKEQKSQGDAAQKSAEQQKTQLSDKKTERILNDLMKKEMETKKKFEGVKSNGKTKKSGKDW